MTAKRQNSVTQKKRDFLALDDFGAIDLVQIVERTQDLATFWKERRMPQSLGASVLDWWSMIPGGEIRRPLILLFSRWALEDTAPLVVQGIALSNSIEWVGGDDD